jgi:hypothetical protein
MALSDMFGLLGGGTAPDPLDIYGDLFSKEQKAALAQRSASEGLLRMAGAFGKAAQPSRMPTSFMGALGEAAGALSGSGDEAAKTAIQGMKVAEDVQASRANRAIQAKYKLILEAQMRRAGIDPASPQGKQIVQQTLANPAAAGGDLSGSTGTPGTVGDFPTGAGAPQPPGAPQLNAFGMPPPQDLTRFGIPLRPGQSPPGAPAEAAQSLSPLTPRAQLPPNMTSGRAGAGMPPVNGMPIDPYDPNFGFAPPPPQQNTGLLPPPPGASPGQSLQGPGVLASLAAGGGAPPPFQQALSTLTGSAAPGAPDLSNFTAADAGGGGDAGDDWQRVKPLIRKYESGNRNINQQVVGPQGGYNPSVGRPTGPSSASGYYQMIDPTWRAAARKVGIDTNRYPRAIDAPEELQDKAAEALYREQGLRPWAPYNRQLAAAIGYQGARGAPDLSNMAGDAGGGGDDAAPAGGGVIPGLNMTPEQLGLLNAYGQLGGLKSPFDSLLETYYKSPGYIAEAERTRAQAGKDVDLKMDPLIVEQKKRAEYKVDMQLKPELDAAVARLQSPILKEREQAKADIDRVTKQMEQAGAAALTPSDATVVGPGGVLTTQKITNLEFAQRQKARADRIARGDMSMQPGDIVGTPIGAAPAEHQYITTPEGKISAVPVPGTPAAQKAAEAESKKLQTEHQKLIARDTVVREVDNIGKLMEDSTLPTTGFVGSILQNLGGTSANDIRVARQTLESRLSSDAINAQRAASPTGAAFGNTSDTDMAILRTALVNLDQSQTKEQFRDRLQILKQAYVDAVHGPGMSRLLPEAQVLKKPEPPSAREWKSGDIVDYPDGSQRQLKGEEWVITKPPRK